MRAYFATMTGAVVVPNGFSGIDYNGHGLPNAGQIGLVLADTSPAQHTTLLGDASVVYLPIEDAGGNPLPFATALFSDISAANRTTCRSRMEAQGVPTQDFSLTDPVRWALMRAKRRMLLRQVLGADDFTEGLDTLVSAIPLAKRQRIATALQARGFDTSVIVGSDTIREAIRKLAIQVLPVIRTGDE